MPALSKLDQLKSYIVNSLDEYCYTNGLVAGTPVVLDFTGNRSTVRIHCASEFVGVPTLGDFLFHDNVLKRLTQLPDGLTIINEYTEAFFTALSAISTNFGSMQFEFLELVIRGTSEVSGTVPVQLTAEVRYQNATGAFTLPATGALFTIVSGSDLAMVTPDGTFKSGKTTVGGEVVVQARFITTQGNRFATKKIKILPNYVLVPEKLAIYGLSTLKGGATSGYVAAIVYTDGTTETVNPRWRLDRSFAVITANGVLTTKNIFNPVSELTLTAEVSFQGVTYNATLFITVTRTGDIALAPRAGVGPGSITSYQALLNILLPLDTYGQRFGSFGAKSGVGERVYVAYPAAYGPGMITNDRTKATNDFKPPTTVQALFGGELVTWLIYETQFDNIAGTWSIS